jgi:predicted PurR-regulated permease PerM
MVPGSAPPEIKPDSEWAGTESTTRPFSFSPWSNRQVIYATLLVVGISLAMWLLYRFSQIVLILFISIVFGTAIRPAVRWLNLRGISRQVGVIIVYCVLFFLVGGLVIWLLPLLTQQVEAITIDLPAYYADFRTGWLTSPSYILQQIALQMPVDATRIISGIQPQSGETVSSIAPLLAFVNILSRSLVTIIAVFIIAFCWTLDSERYIRSALLWLPPNQRERIRSVIGEIDEKLGGFLLGQGILCLTIGILSLVAYTVIGLPYALVLACIAGILEAVPVFGPILGAAPALMIALSTGPTETVWVVIATVLIQGLENYLLVPRVMKHSVGVNSLLILLSMVAFTSLLGLPGAMLAIPMAAMIQLLVDRFLFAPAHSEVPEIQGRDQLSRLSYETGVLTLDVRKRLRENDHISNQEQEMVDALEAISADLNRMLSQVDQMEETT